MKSQYWVAITLVSIFLASSTIPVFAFSDPNFIQSPQDRAKLFQKLQLSQSSNSSYLFSIIITPTGAKQTNVILSPDNLTAIKNNVAFFTACGDFNNGLCQPPVLTTANPNSNYCPLAKFILTNQDGYLSKLYNQTSGKDLTPLVYPNYCFVETGSNPVNGQGPSPNPVPVSDLTMNTDKQTYNFGDKIIINGTSLHQVPDIGIVVRAPNGNLVTVDQTTAIGGIWSDSFQTGGKLWNQTGVFTIMAVQGTSSVTKTFVLTSAVPEFPQTLGLIFSVVIMMGIVLSAKSMRK